MIFELSRYEELNYRQIAEALELAPKTVENQLGRALRILRQALAGVLKDLYCLLLCGLLTYPTPSDFAFRLGVKEGATYLLPNHPSASRPMPI